MSSDRSRYRLACLGVVCLALVAVTSSCFLKPKKKKAVRNLGGASGLIITSENDVRAIFLDRIGNGDTARLQFKTSQPAFCELAFYTQDPTIEPKKDAPKVQACLGNDARLEFVEKLEGLRTDVLYEIAITAWTAGSDKAHGETITVRESATTPGVDGDDDGKIKELMVARFNIPLMVAEVHRHTLAEAGSMSAIRAKLAREAGCRVGVPTDAAPFRDANPDVGIKGLLTRDFAAGSATAHPDQPGRLQLTFPSLNDGPDKWTLLYQLGDKDVSVPARPMARILNMEMESAAITAFDKPQLLEAEDPLVIDKTRPLKFAWTTGNLLDQTYLTVTIGRPDDDHAVYCVFPAEKKSGVIEPALLEQLNDGRHVVLAELNTNQMWAKDGWLVSVYDWRAGRIEKQ